MIDDYYEAEILWLLRKKGRRKKEPKFKKECVFSKWLVPPDKLIDVRHRMAKEKKRKALKLWRRGRIMH